MAFAGLVRGCSGNSGWVETIWTFAVGLVGAGSALWPAGGESPNSRQWLVAALVAIWSLRLGLHIAAARAIAEHTDIANTQHYEVPAAFFAQVLGPNRKYSSCFYNSEASTLQEAEEEALRQTEAHADLADPAEQFDRIVSVEMLEHMMNWPQLLARVKSWLKPDGRFFMHIFTHRSGTYLFDSADREDWITQHFFTGGVMPSHHLIRQYADLFSVEKEWRWSGTHDQRTAMDWLANFDAHASEIEAVLGTIYGNETPLWMRRWRWFFLATAGLFGYADGDEWGVSHYRMKAV